MIGQQAAPASRIYHGETVLAVVWSNAAVNMTSSWRVVYDDGTSETLILDRFTTGSARAAQLISTSQVAKHDGYVTEGFVFSDAPQRGQTYVVVYISQGYNPGDVRAPIAKGYVYASVPLALGQQVEPGPAGGPGQRITVLTADPGANAEVATVTVPVGAIWKLTIYNVQLIQGITQTPLPTLNIRDAAADQMAQLPITNTAIGASSTANLTWGIGLLQISFTAVVGDEFHTSPLPVLYLVAGDTFRTITDGLGANSNYGPANYTYEEWVMPN